MNVFINNKEHELETMQSLSTLLQHIGFHNHPGIAIAVNNAIIPKASWNEHVVAAGDRITIITATQGG